MRYFAIVIVASLSSAALADTEVSLLDHRTGKPIVGQVVALTEPQSCTRAAHGGCTPEHPRRVTARTDKSGVARFKVGADWHLEEVRVASFLTGCPHHDLIETETRHKLFVDSSTDHPDAPNRRIDCRLVSKAALVVTRPADAILRASRIPEIADWLGSHRNLTPTAKLVEIEWDVSWGDSDVMKRLVYVDAVDGDAQVGGRWTD